MSVSMIIIIFLIVMAMVASVVIFVIWMVFQSKSDGTIKRLNEEISRTNARQAELNQKIRKADEELLKRQAEARTISDQMQTLAEDEAKAEREKIINKARRDSEEIIEKAQNAKEKMKKELEQNIDSKALRFSVRILDEILTEKATQAFETVLVEDFIEKLKNVEMDHITAEITEAEIVTLKPVSLAYQKQISQVIKSKLGRELAMKASTAKETGCGVILKFGSMALDGSLSSAIKEKAILCQQEIESR
ncbi:MAG: F0F1 ATP synthase subunit delta [Candidatus Omnitrophica bacterium]|nr:F0F1 ATP synthase subunit delta [Candidatus Omnitrophota bacterium]